MSAGPPIAEEEDVNVLSFGAEFSDASFLANSSVALLLSKIAEKKYSERPPPDIFGKAKTYAIKFGGAVELTDVAAIDELYTSLRGLEFVRSVTDSGDAGADGAVEKLRLVEYQIVALSNLNPSSVSAARSLIPSLDTFTDEEIGQILAILQRANSKYIAGSDGGMVLDASGH